MERFKDFRIKGTTENLKKYVVDLKVLLNKSEWKSRDDKVTVPLVNFQDKNETLCIQTPDLKYGNDSLSAFVWIMNLKGDLEVVNITPLPPLSRLNHAQYNFILDTFKEQFASELGEYDLTLKESKDYFDMSDVIGADAYKKLKNFSETANKSTGCSHPNDFDRWCDFIIAVYKEKASLSTEDLMRWLEENSWSEDIAEELSLQFEYGLGLLNHYGI